MARPESPIRHRASPAAPVTTWSRAHAAARPPTRSAPRRPDSAHRTRSGTPISHRDDHPITTRAGTPRTCRIAATTRRHGACCSTSPRRHATAWKRARCASARADPRFIRRRLARWFRPALGPLWHRPYGSRVRGRSRCVTMVHALCSARSPWPPLGKPIACVPVARVPAGPPPPPLLGTGIAPRGLL
jgi:hypothetical protein